jgi:hypothetical protein
MEQSRYGKYRQRRTPRHPRSKYLQGSFEDRNRWIRCWNCQSINDLNRLGGAQEKAGNIYFDDIEPSEIPILQGDDPINGYFTSLNLACTLDTLDMCGNLMELGPDGVTPKPVEIREVVAQANRGCWFCGESDLP